MDHLYIVDVTLFLPSLSRKSRGKDRTQTIWQLPVSPFLTRELELWLYKTCSVLRSYLISCHLFTEPKTGTRKINQYMRGKGWTRTSQASRAHHVLSPDGWALSRIASVNARSKPVVQVLLSLSHRWRIWSSERLSDSTQVAQLVRSGKGSTPRTHIMELLASITTPYEHFKSHF